MENVKNSKSDFDSSNNEVDTLNKSIQPFLYKIDSAQTVINSKQAQIVINQNEIIKGLKELQTPNYVLLILGALIGAVFGYLVSRLQSFVKYKCKLKNYKKLYEPFVGLYLVKKKYEPEEVHYCFELLRDKNKLYVKNGISVLGHRDVYLELQMNEPSLYYGTGYHCHEIENDVLRYGFWEVQLANDMILSHLTIYNEKGEQNSEPYVWIKQKEEEKLALIEKYRTEQLKIN
ncbi:MAG: hypothetical protein RBT49_14375 [Bacteroidales bacterium]|jgi:uncharacterized membrane protein|nr:hypothetical protein [Bacteroidales bacterium]